MGITQTKAAKAAVAAAQAVSFCKDMALPFFRVLVFPRLKKFTGSKEFAGSPPNVPPVTIVPHRWNCWATRIIVPIADGCANL
ncbi:MAG: hypothetical protein WAV18_32210 [Roseiarcus sp.]